MQAGARKAVPTRGVLLCVLLCMVASSVGCQQWPGNHAMRQYQIESERLLSEYRSQKKRAEELEQRNVQLERRLGESEREIAKLQGRNPSSRMAANPGGSMISGGGLPDARPGTSGRLSSGNTSLGPGDSRGSNQWRPIPGR
ncbi:MAG: hypothetical protein RLZZ396_2772 [Planctomycetota bacterium]|jgi:hypothetical protein